MTGARICVAQIGAPHGLHGEVKLRSFTADPTAIRDYAPLESEDGTAKFEIEEIEVSVIPNVRVKNHPSMD